MTRQIPVKASPGMFSDEFNISIELVDGNIVTLFADSSLVKDDGKGNQLLETALISEDRDSQVQTVLLPTETFETRSRYVEIKL